MNNIQVKKATNDIEVRYVVTRNAIPIPSVALWLDWESMRSPLTGKAYAYCICSFFRFLDKYQLDFRKDVTRSTIEEYLKQLIFASTPVTQIKSQIPYKGLQKHLTAIKNLYKWLESEHEIIQSPTKSLHSSTRYAQNYNKTKMLYGQIHDYKIDNTFLNRVYYHEPRKYIKWYTNEEITIISQHFTNIRDKAMFLVSIETGMRIGELCGLKLDNFDRYEKSLTVERDNNVENLAYAKTSNRTNYISSDLTHLLSEYLIEVRNKIPKNTGYLFVNYHGAYRGNPVSPTNFLSILKRAARRGGIDPKLFRTHSGRSTRAQKLIELMRNDPDSGVTMAFILEDMGWSSERSTKPYIKRYSLQQKQQILSGLQKRYDLSLEEWYE
ncbi:tyrosine-type recombinase/integrase [Lactiplantibacillus sp. WILCCON 0030]|uniref:Tyrosine-type recombinase/integrase n=1 Tax=Lactiplantibacillus brownii TaxID=3069269 RepID=A0ABU1ABA0_9LACO|nr:tyrosine-type recombinase/integrase [Lactiplantibacillus brownii]MDQ7938232.1 tyrosine-type recombinase/integrase [Lactiplantibacillus brownii]